MKTKLKILVCAGLLFFTAALLALSMRVFYHPEHDTAAPRDGQIKVACVGDSITYGLGTSQWPQNTYPMVLQGLLGSKYHVQNFGVSSYAVQQSADMSYRTLPEYRQSLEYEADIVVFMMGSNDTKPVNWQGAEAYRGELLSLLDSYGDTKLVLCTICTMFFRQAKDAPADIYRLQPNLAAEVSAVVREVAVERGYALVDINELTSAHPEWFPDGVHPNDKGSAAIAREIYAEISKVK